MNATAVLVRRVKQGVAAWYRLQLKDKVRNGLKQHALEGWNIGPAPYGYAGERHPHPIAAKAAEGRRKTRLITDPDRAPAVAAIFDWRALGRPGTSAIAIRLAASPGLYPPPPGGEWHPLMVWRILRNPKYTGHQVFGRLRNDRLMPEDQWLWTPQPVHPAIITRETWHAAQQVGAEHATSGDPGIPDRRNRSARFCPLRSRVFCRDCTRRMSGLTRPSREWYACTWRRTQPRDLAASPDHPPSSIVRADLLAGAIARFCARRVFGPERAALLAAAQPREEAARAAARQHKADNLARRLKQIDTAENAAAEDLAAIAASGAPRTARDALRARILARFTSYENDRQNITRDLDALTAAAPQGPGSPGLLDALPRLAGILDQAPPRLQAQLYDALGITATWHHRDRQVTIRAVITTTTPHALAALIRDAEHPATSTQLPSRPFLPESRPANAIPTYGP